MVAFSGGERRLLRNWLLGFQNWFTSNVEHPLANEVPFYKAPPEIVGFENRLTDLQNELGRPPMDDAGDVADGCLPALKTIILHQRRELANQLDEPRSKTSHPGLLQGLDAHLEPFGVLMSQTWFQETAALSVPRLSEFLALERVESIFHRFHARPARQFDEKFHILQSPALVRLDLRYFRGMCAVRGRSVTVAYLDIDHFKDLNSKYGEANVDIDVLPVFMRELEASVFFRGFAYRYGGDEYVVLLPNVDERLGLSLLDDIRLRLQATAYRGVDERTTVSIGMCVVTPECFLTEREIEERANRAKNYAKSGGRNRIATYRGQIFQDDDLYVAEPLRPGVSPEGPPTQTSRP